MSQLYLYYARTYLHLLSTNISNKKERSKSKAETGLDAFTNDLTIDISQQSGIRVLPRNLQPLHL
jgi:hypothetical protein